MTVSKKEAISPQAAARLEALRSAPLDSWVALSEDESRIVAVGATYAEVAENSERAGVADPLIVKIPAKWAPLSVHAR
jgi:hypothetical protein